MMVKFKKIQSAILSGMIGAASIAGTFASTAPSLNAAAANDNYAKLLQYSLYFYDANMCGDITGKCAIEWRGNCHTSDGVKGGYHDAGDHVMFGLPQGYTASVLEWSYYEFKDAFDATSQTAHLKVILDHFADFFKASAKMSGGNVSEILYQKGDGNADHDYWGPPESQGGSRQMMWTSNGAGDVAADYAAALAIHYLNFGDKESLEYAEALYNYATRNPGTVNHGTFYSNNSSADEIANAAGWLYMATKKDNYKNDCAGKQAQYLGWVDGWENRQLGAACVYSHITGDWGKVNDWIGSKANGSGYFFLDKWGSARLNASMQFTALVATKNSGANYGSWCQGQMDYLLGNNPKNTCYVTGFAPNSAKHAHHRAASVSFSDSNYTHTLIGALVGGPKDSSGNDYVDTIEDYVCNEVALDYNAGLVGAAAGLYSMYKTGSTDTSITGVTKVYSGGGSGNVDPPATTQTPDQPQQTTQAPSSSQNPSTQTTKAPGQTTGGNGKYTAELGEKFDYDKMGENERMIGWQWADLGVPKGEQPIKVEVNISSNNGNIGDWVGAFGTSTTDKNNDYWYMTDEMKDSFSSNKGTITWEIPSATSKIIQTQYKGELKVGFWWINCRQFTVDSITVYTDGSGSSSSTPAQTTKAPETTKAPDTQPTQPQQTQPSQGGNITYGDVNCDGKVSIADAAAILQHLGNGDRYKLSDDGRKNADCENTGDGVTVKDAMAIQKFVAHVYNKLPV